MRLFISAEGDHEPKGHHFMTKDGTGFLIDLSGVAGALHDPTIARVEWGPVLMPGGITREGGAITRRDGTKQQFFDLAALKPYLAAYEARKAELLARPAGGK